MPFSKSLALIKQKQKNWPHPRFELYLPVWFLMLDYAHLISNIWFYYLFRESEDLWKRLDLGSKNLREGILGRILNRGVTILRLSRAQVGVTLSRGGGVIGKTKFITSSGTLFMVWMNAVCISAADFFVKVKLVTVVKGYPKAPFSIATTSRCRGRCFSFPWIALLYPWNVPYNAEC